MDIFKVIKFYLSFIGMDPQTDGLNVRNLEILLIIGQFALSAIAFLFFRANNVKEYAQSFYSSITISANGIGLLLFMSESKKVFKLIEKIELIIENQLTDPVSRTLYKFAVEVADKWAEIYHLAIFKLSIPLGGIPLVAISYYMYSILDLGRDSFQLPLLVMLPFDWHTPLGYVFALIDQGIVMGCICHCTACQLGLLLGFYEMMMAFGIDIKRKLYAFNEQYQVDNSNDEMNKNLGLIIQFRSDVVEMVDGFIGIFRIPITFIFVWSVCTISDTLLLFQDPNELFLLVALSFWSFAQVFLFCEVGERIIHQFLDLGYVMYDCDWYLFPLNIRRIVPIILSATQDPITISGFGNIRCTREVFQNVVSRGFSYFTLLKQL